MGLLIRLLQHLMRNQSLWVPLFWQTTTLYPKTKKPQNDAAGGLTATPESFEPQKTPQIHRQLELTAVPKTWVLVRNINKLPVYHYTTWCAP